MFRLGLAVPERVANAEAVVCSGGLALPNLDRLRLVEQDAANEGGAGLAGQTRLVRPGPVGDRGSLEQVGGYL